MINTTMQDNLKAARLAARTATDTGKSRAHLVTLERGFLNKPILTAHVSTDVGTSKDRRSVLASLRKANTGMATRLKKHRQSKLEAAQTLEDFVGRYGDAEIVYDPTQVVSRIRALVGLAMNLRATFTSEELIGTYWDATQRCVYIVLDHTRYFTDRKIQSIDIKSAEDRAKAVIQDYLNTEGCIAQTVLLSFEMPKTSLVPVDRTSFLDIADVVSKRRGLSLAAVAALVGAVGATSVAAEPAVSQINSKLSFQSTAHSNNVGTDIGAGVLAGSVTFPVGVRYGFQIDGALGKDGGDELAGLGGHLFWRDPSVVMVGLIFGTVDINRDGAAVDQRTDRIGLELEYYVEDFTVYAMAGRQSGRNILEGDFGTLGLGWYVTEDLFLSMDFAQTPDYDNITTLGVEWQTGFGAAKNVTVFADASTGSNDHDRITVGFRMYFGGGSKPLADRHRRDDPMRNITMDIVNTLSGPANGAGNNGQYGGAMQEVELGERCRINDVLCQYFANLQMGGNQMGPRG